MHTSYGDHPTPGATLATINGEAFAAPALQFWGRHAGNRIAIICSNPHGAVEVWHSTYFGSAELGGVEFHSPAPLFDGDEPHEDCTILGGRCYTDGTSMGYTRQFLPLIQAGDSPRLLRLLADWHAGEFAQGAAR